MFLKRTKYPQISESDLFVGATVTIYSRQFKIVSYADDFTKKAFHSEEIDGQNLKKSFLLIKPYVYFNSGKIIEQVENAGFKISNLKMTRLQDKEVNKLFSA